MNKSLFQQVVVAAVSVAALSLGSWAQLQTAQAQDSFKSELDKELRSLTRKVRAEKSKKRGYRVAQNTSLSSDLNRYENNSVKDSVAKSTETTYSILPSGSSEGADSSNISTSETISTTTSSTSSTTGTQNTAPAEVAPIIVEDTPLKDTTVKKLKSERKSVESATELTLAEELEQDRIEREKERAARARGSLNKKASSTSLESEFEATETKTKRSNSRSTTVAPTVDDSTEERTRFYITATGGTADYPGLRNARGVYAFGFNVGLRLPERLAFELGYHRATFDIENWQPFMMYPVFVGGFSPTLATPAPRITQMDQNMYSAALKYQILKTRVTPVVGVTAAYSERIFNDRQYNGFFGQQPTTLRSNTFDAGPTVGIDVRIGSMFEAGIDFKYMFNLTYRRDQYLESFGTNYGYTPIEEAQWWLGTAHFRILF